MGHFRIETIMISTASTDNRLTKCVDHFELESGVSFATIGKNFSNFIPHSCFAIDNFKICMFRAFSHSICGRCTVVCIMHYF